MGCVTERLTRLRPLLLPAVEFAVVEGEEDGMQRDWQVEMHLARSVSKIEARLILFGSTSAPLMFGATIAPTERERRREKRPQLYGLGRDLGKWT